MQLYFMRHGLAEDNFDGEIPDVQRQLVPKGEAHTRLTAQVLKTLAIKPARLYASPLVRARQTAAIVAEALDVKVTIRQELDFNFNAAAVELLTHDLSDEDDAIFVGHEPSMSATVSRIIGGGDLLMKKGSVARVEVLSRAPVRGQLLWLLPAGIVETIEQHQTHDESKSD